MTAWMKSCRTLSGLAIAPSNQSKPYEGAGLTSPSSLQIDVLPIPKHKNNLNGESPQTQLPGQDLMHKCISKRNGCHKNLQIYMGACNFSLCDARLLKVLSAHTECRSLSLQNHFVSFEKYQICRLDVCCSPLLLYLGEAPLHKCG